MITTLTGENSFGLQLSLKKLVDAFVVEHGDLALERVDGEESEFSKMQEALSSLPFFASKKLVVLRNPSKNKQFLEAAEQLLGDLPESTDVIIIETKLDKRLSYYKFLKKKTEFMEFNELDQNVLAQWLVTAAKEQTGTISLSDARYLVERVGMKQQLLSNEIEKLLIYDPKITRQTIDLLTVETPQSTIFQLLESAFAGNTKVALKLYKEQRSLKVEPQQIIAMLAWQLHVLAIIKTAGERSVDTIASEAHLNPFVVRKSLSIARNITLGELKKLIADLLTIDTRSKRSAIDLDEALMHFLLKLSQ